MKLNGNQTLLKITAVESRMERNPIIKRVFCCAQTTFSIHGVVLEMKSHALQWVLWALISGLFGYYGTPDELHGQLIVGCGDGVAFWVRPYITPPPPQKKKNEEGAFCQPSTPR